MVPFSTFAIVVATTLVASTIILVSVASSGLTSANILCKTSPAVFFGSADDLMNVSTDSSISGIELANSGSFLLSTNSCAKKSKG